MVCARRSALGLRARRAPRPRRPRRRPLDAAREPSPRAAAGDDAETRTTKRRAADAESQGAALKAAWYGAEAFGNVLGALRGPAPREGAASSPLPRDGPLPREEALEAIESDYAASYFVSGKGDLAAYDPQCEFADPFVAFKGVGRFKANVSNLGGLMDDIQLDVTSFEELADGSVQAEWRFSCILDLPWRPRLAAKGGTTHVFDEASGLVVRHVERWDVEPSEVLKALLKPASKVPENRIEAVMWAVSAGDVPGVWSASSPALLPPAAAVAAVSLVHLLFAHHPFGGVAGGFEAITWLVLAFGVYTEISQILGTGGGEM